LKDAYTQSRKLYENNLQVTKNRVSDTTKAIAHSSQNVNSVISAANVGDNTRKFAVLEQET
jgi:hypothetical protein